MSTPPISVESTLSDRIGVLQRCFQEEDETRRTMEIQPLYVRLWEKLGAKLEPFERSPLTEGYQSRPRRGTFLGFPEDSRWQQWQIAPWSVLGHFFRILTTRIRHLFSGQALTSLTGQLWKLIQKLASSEPSGLQSIPRTACSSSHAARLSNGAASSLSSDEGHGSESDTRRATNSTAATSAISPEYRTCYVCDGDGCPIPQPILSQIPVPDHDSLPNWTAHRLESPAAYEFNKEYAAIRLSIASAATGAKGGGTDAVKGASKPVQLQAFSKLTGSKGLWAEYDLMTSVWLSFTVVSLHRSSGMQPIMAFQQAAMACTIPDYAGTPDGEDQKYAAAALQVSSTGFGSIAKHNERGMQGAEMIAAILTRPGYGRHTGSNKTVGSEDSCKKSTLAPKRDKDGVDRNTWLHMRWYDGGVVPYFTCHDWSLRDGAVGRLTSQHSCPLVDSCYDITIWLNDLSDYALDRTIGEGGNSLVYALSQSGECKPSILADFCSDVLDGICECRCNSSLHETAADIAVGFTAMYALAFRYRGLENAWLARRVQLPGVVQRGWLIRGGSMTRNEWPRVPYKSDWSPLSTTVPLEVNSDVAMKSWKARCGRLATDGPGCHLIEHAVSRFAASQSCDETIVCEALEHIWHLAEPAVQKLGGDSAAMYTSVENLVVSVLEWPAIFASSPAHTMSQCSVRDKVALENILLESAAYGLWCCGTNEASTLVRFLVGLVACISELTIVATYRRVPMLWSEDKVEWKPTEHSDCKHPDLA